MVWEGLTGRDFLHKMRKDEGTITRDDAAQMIWNTLEYQYTLIFSTKGKSLDDITVGDTVRIVAGETDEHDTAELDILVYADESLPVIR